jgi:hypothetical protein
MFAVLGLIWPTAYTWWGAMRPMRERPLILLPVLAGMMFGPALAWAENHSDAAPRDAAKASTVTPNSSAVSRPKGRSLSARAAARRAQRDSAARERRDKELAEWLARLEARGVDPWPDPESDDDHAAALAKSREMVDEVIAAFPGTQLYETEHFLFTSNMPQEQAGPYVAYLDKMYEWMCQLYGVPKAHKVWLGGKAPVFAFLERDQFEAFEAKYFPDARQQLGTLTNIYGLCHQSMRGEVIIACYRGDDPNDFGQMLVHETSHGFIHRYKTKAQLPNWVDEGMADLIGSEMVPASKTVKDRELKAIAQLAQQRSLGGLLTTPRIQAWQYGMASNLNRFLLRSNRQSYVRFIENLKEGMKWEEALLDAYGSTPEEMLAHYAQWINVAELRP